MTASKLFFLTTILSLAACDIPDKSIGDGDGDGGSTTDNGDGDGDGGPVDCELQCGNTGRECELDACCSCAMAGGQLLILESFPPQYACEHPNGPVPGWEPPDCDWGGCEDQVSELEIDEVFEAVGVSPQEVINTIGAPMDAPHEWIEDDLQLNVPGPMTLVSLTAIPTGTYRGIERIWVPPADLPDLEGSCESRVEVDVDVTLTTADGALDESFAAVAQTAFNANPDFNPPTVVLYHYFASPNGFNGTLELSTDDPHGTLDPEAELSVQFGRTDGDVEDMRGGSLSIGLEILTEEWAGYGWLEFGRWFEGG
ncbi:hypothetical protein DB30_05260 [Enhygromyxa salina]|uniref:Uncharacterized protein n=1 Tax=Enhygromyxa salina TaxID=215803 RepID=A0A0C2D1K8_9BACT|nr:hypothetical protein [Enhygromyxa salina]KIG15690.1 hypothetical protein DB30_05260 [Enhygromyxa salina]